MIGTLPGRVVLVAVIGIVLAIGALGALSLGSVTSAPLYLLALALGLASVVAVLLPWPPAAGSWPAVGVVVSVLAVGLAVVAVLPPGRPGYALWFPGLVWLPCAGLALRGHPALAVVGAVGSALTTLAWAWTEPGVAFGADGLYRVVSPTAVVVVAVVVARLMRQYGEEVERAHAEQLEAARLSAGARSAEGERRVRLAQIEQIAAPVLVRLRDGEEVDARLATECRLLEAALRDGIRGRHLIDAAVRETLWAARTRGVEVTLLDDSGTEAGEVPPKIAEVVRRCTVAVVERLERGRVTVRLAEPGGGTVVVLTPQAGDLVGSVRDVLAGQHLGHSEVEMQHDPELADELVVTFRRATPPPTTAPSTRAATAMGRV